jgi:23S rRNA (guanine745-N1)-methyltransferase
MMNENCLQVLMCPVCDEVLTQIGNRLLSSRLLGSSLQCAQGHSFDISREGYVNLLVAGHKQPKILGDAREMIQARRRFLEMGYYRPLAEAINSLVAAQVVGQTAVTIADIGCGEGWYLGQLQYKLAHKDVCYVGMDAAKTAVRLAAKRYSDAQFVVADVRRKIPFANQSITALLNIFAPRNAIEFARVLQTEGLLLIVIPQPNHLRDLREALSLLDIEPEKELKITEQLADGFTLQEIRPIAFPLRLDRNSLLDLTQMTPNYWHLTAESWSMIDGLTEMEVEAAFELMVFVKRET